MKLRNFHFPSQFQIKSFWNYVKKLFDSWDIKNGNQSSGGDRTQQLRGEILRQDWSDGNLVGKQRRISVLRLPGTLFLHQSRHLSWRFWRWWRSQRSSPHAHQTCNVRRWFPSQAQPSVASTSNIVSVSAHMNSNALVWITLQNLMFFSYRIVNSVGWLWSMLWIC